VTERKNGSECTEPCQSSSDCVVSKSWTGRTKDQPFKTSHERNTLELGPAVFFVLCFEKINTACTFGCVSESNQCQSDWFSQAEAFQQAAVVCQSQGAHDELLWESRGLMVTWYTAINQSRHSFAERPYAASLPVALQEPFLCFNTGNRPTGEAGNSLSAWSGDCGTRTGCNGESTALQECRACWGLLFSLAWSTHHAAKLLTKQKCWISSCINHDPRSGASASSKKYGASLSGPISASWTHLDRLWAILGLILPGMLNAVWGVWLNVVVQVPSSACQRGWSYRSRLAAGTRVRAHNTVSCCAPHSLAASTASPALVCLGPAFLRQWNELSQASVSSMSSTSRAVGYSFRELMVTRLCCCGIVLLVWWREYFSGSERVTKHLGVLPVLQMFLQFHLSACCL